MPSVSVAMILLALVDLVVSSRIDEHGIVIGSSVGGVLGLVCSEGPCSALLYREETTVLFRSFSSLI